MVAHGAKHLLLKADQAVGDQDHLALGIGPQGTQRFLDGSKHLRAAARLELRQPGLRLATMRRCGGHRLRAPAARSIGKRDHLQLVRVGQRINEGGDHTPGLFKRPVHHGAAGVQKDDQIPRQGFSPARLRRHDREEPVGVFRGRPPQPRSRDLEPHPGPGAVDRPPHDEIAVERRTHCVAQGDASHVLGLSLEPVRGGLGPASSAQRVADHELQRDAHTRRPVGDINGDRRRVHDAPLGAQIARRHHRGKAPLPHPLGQPVETLVHRDLDAHLRARRDVADLLSEMVGALLIEQPGGAPLDQRLLEPLSCVCPPVDLAGHAPLSDLELVAFNRPGRRQGHRVDRLQGLCVRIAEDLNKPHPSQPARRFGVNGRAQQRQLGAFQADEPRPVTQMNRLHGLAHVRPSCHINAWEIRLVTSSSKAGPWGLIRVWPRRRHRGRRPDPTMASAPRTRGFRQDTGAACHSVREESFLAPRTSAMRRGSLRGRGLSGRRVGAGARA